MLAAPASAQGRWKHAAALVAQTVVALVTVLLAIWELDCAVHLASAGSGWHKPLGIGAGATIVALLSMSGMVGSEHYLWRSGRRFDPRRVTDGYRIAPVTLSVIGVVFAAGLAGLIVATLDGVHAASSSSHIQHDGVLIAGLGESAVSSTHSLPGVLHSLPYVDHYASSEVTVLLEHPVAGVTYTLAYDPNGWSGLAPGKTACSGATSCLKPLPRVAVSVRLDPASPTSAEMAGIPGVSRLYWELLLGIDVVVGLVLVLSLNARVRLARQEIQARRAAPIPLVVTESLSTDVPMSAAYLGSVAQGSVVGMHSPGATSPGAVGGTAPAAYPASWYPDPLGRHVLRFFDGQSWTEWVSDTPGATPVSDPIGG